MLSHSHPDVSLQETNIGDDAKPSQNTRQDAADADTVDFTSTVQKDSPVPASRTIVPPIRYRGPTTEALM